MKLSVLIPMYNAESYIERCLLSLKNQNIAKSDYEVIVFNDGSSDASKATVERFMETNSNVLLYSHKNEGVISTRNKLLKLAKGTYVYFMDADDYIAHYALKEVLEFAFENEMDIMGFDTLVTTDNTVFDLGTSFNELELPKIVSGPNYLKENRNLRLEVWWFLIRKDFLNTNEVDFIEGDYDGDVVFTLRLFLYAKRVAYTPISVYRYFQSSESTMRGADNAYRKKIVQYFVALIKDLSDLIDILDRDTIEHKDIIKSNFIFRRDAFTFFTIIKMIRAGLSVKTIKKNLFELEKVEAYPIKSFTQEEYNSTKYKFLTYVVNHKKPLFILAKLHRVYVNLTK